MSSIKTLYKKHIATRRKPRNLNKFDEFIFEKSYSDEIGETTLLQLNNANILEDTIFDFSSFKFYLSYTHILSLKKNYLLKKILLLFKPYCKIDKAIWITDEWSAEYFHWLTDALTRLIAVESFGNSYTVILPKEYMQKEYIKQSLELLNYTAFYYSKKRRLKVKELIVPGHTAFTGNYNKQLINTLRERFLKESEIKPYRKIFISRQKANKRKILNEKEVVLLLSNYDYEIHYFEDYTFKKQIAIMSQAKSLISLHGAGLTNMLFMRSDGQILELRNNNDSHNNCFFSLASALEHNYYYLINKGNVEDTYSGDIIVNINKLRETIVLMER